MDWYWKAIDRMDAFRERLTPGPRSRRRKDTVPSAVIMAFYILGVTLGGFMFGGVVINALQAYLRHDSFGFIASTVGVIGAAVYCVANGSIILRAYAKTRRVTS